jgi:hypothetical protein
MQYTAVCCLLRYAAVHVLLYLVLVCTLPSSAAGNLLSVDIRPAAQHADISIVYRYAPGAYSTDFTTGFEGSLHSPRVSDLRQEKLSPPIYFTT